MVAGQSPLPQVFRTEFARLCKVDTAQADSTVSLVQLHVMV